MSSLTASLSLAAELIEGHVDVVGANGVCWGARLVLTITLSHFI
jgi:dienelactone hydrolase